MALIEGIGDEVTVVAALLSLMFVAISVFFYRHLHLEDLSSISVYWNQLSNTRQVYVAAPPRSTSPVGRSAENLVQESAVLPNQEASRHNSGTTNRNGVTEHTTNNASAETVTTTPELRYRNLNFASNISTAWNRLSALREVPVTVPPSTTIGQSPDNIIQDSTSLPTEGSASEQTVIEETLHINSQADKPNESGDASSSTHQASEAETNATLPNELNSENSVPANSIRVRLKYLNETERLVVTQLTETIGDFKRTHFSTDLSDNKMVRLIFNGQLLRDNMTLHSYRIEDRTVLHVHISQAQTPPNHSASVHPDLDISGLMWPLFSLILGICWVMYIRYPEYFSITSIIILIAFSASFLVVYVHSQVQVP